ncbi:MAG: hypothetical protein HQK67_11950, partial [Desulfamplus sp.]|nr:hypothetical protein [Desulfamplus sp.]
FVSHATASDACCKTDISTDKTGIDAGKTVIKGNDDIMIVDNNGVENVPIVVTKMCH